MQSLGDDGGEEGRREASCSQEERDSKLLDDGSDEAAKDCEANVPPPQECGSQDQSEPSPDDLRPQPHPDHSGADEYSPAATDSVQENVAQASLIPYLSNLDISEEMEDQEPLPENEEELMVLDSENPMVKAFQANLNSHLRKRLEMLDWRLKEKRELEKAQSKEILEMSVELSKSQEHLAKLYTKLEERHHTKAQAEAKCRQAQEQLEATKSHYYSIKSQESKAKASVSQLEAELDRLTLHLSYTQELSKDLHSNVKAMKTAKHKADTVKNQAEEEKLKQDLYVERLKKDLERLTQQIAMYEAQTTAQAEETKAAKEALSEAEMEMVSLVMARKQLLQKWSSSLMEMGRRDEAFSAMQEAVRNVDHQLILLDREIEGYNKSISEEQENNEKLTMQLNWSQMDCTTSKKLISQKQAQQEALQAQYSTCLRTLKETECTLARLSKEASTHQTEVNNQRRQLEKESAVRLELEDKIMTHMQQKLTHNKAAKYSQRLTKKLTTLKKDKISQLWQLENDLVAVGLESSMVSQLLDSLAQSQKDLDGEITQYNKILESSQAKISSFVILIGQKQAIITNYKKKIYQIQASTGHEDMSPQQLKIQEVMTQTEELETNIKRDQQLWMKQQETLVGMTKEIQANSKSMLKLQMEYTDMQQKNICLESQIDVEHREQKELEKSVMMLKRDQEKLNSLISKKGQLSQALKQENALMEKDFLCKLKEAELESIKLQMKQEKTQEENERLCKCLVEAERHVVLWQKKTELVKETRSVVDSMRKGDIQMMKAEINRMKFRFNKLNKERQQLLKSYGAEMARWQRLDERKFAMRHSSQKNSTKAKSFLSVQGLQRKIKETHKNVERCEEEIRELQETKMSLKDRIEQKRQQLIELRSTNSVLDSDIVNLQDTKDRNFTHLVTLQSRKKMLQQVREGSYKALSTCKSVDVALQSQMERVHAVSTIIHRVCEELPQYQGALRRLLLALAGHTQHESGKHPKSEAKM